MQSHNKSHWPDAIVVPRGTNFAANEIKWVSETYYYWGMHKSNEIKLSDKNLCCRKKMKCHDILHLEKKIMGRNDVRIEKRDCREWCMSCWMDVGKKNSTKYLGWYIGAHHVAAKLPRLKIKQADEMREKKKQHQKQEQMVWSNRYFLFITKLQECWYEKTRKFISCSICVRSNEM